MPFVDFDELKAKTSFEKIVGLLGLALKRSGNQWRGSCPRCNSGGDRALVVTEGKGYFCFSEKQGGDQLALVAHIRDCSVMEAAGFIAGEAAPRTVRTASSTVPQSDTGEEGAKTFAPLSYLEPEHDAVVAIGLDTAFATKHGIGYAPKGILRGTVAIPFRDERGNLLGYVGVTDLKLPPSFTPNVVELKRPA
jgi:DNA primase